MKRAVAWAIVSEGPGSIHIRNLFANRIAASNRCTHLNKIAPLCARKVVRVEITEISAEKPESRQRGAAGNGRARHRTARTTSI